MSQTTLADYQGSTIKRFLYKFCIYSEFSPVVELPRKRESHRQKSEKHESFDGQTTMPQHQGHSNSTRDVQQVGTYGSKVFHYLSLYILHIKGTEKETFVDLSSPTSAT